MYIWLSCFCPSALIVDLTYTYEIQYACWNVYCIVIAIHRAVIVIPTQTWSHNSWSARLFPHQLNIIQGTVGQKENTRMTQEKLIGMIIDPSIHSPPTQVNRKYIYLGLVKVTSLTCLYEYLTCQQWQTAPTPAKLNEEETTKVVLRIFFGRRRRHILFPQSHNKLKYGYEYSVPLWNIIWWWQWWKYMSGANVWQCVMRAAGGHIATCTW